MPKRYQKHSYETVFFVEKEDTVPRQAHDRFFRASLKNPVISKAMIRSQLPDKLEQLCQWETLKMESPQTFTKTLQETIADSILSVKLKQEQELHLLVHLEHHTQPKWWIALYFRQFREKYLFELANSQKCSVLPIVYPIFVYQNKKPFPHTTDYYELFADPELAREYMDKPLEVLNVCQASDEILEKEPDASPTYLTLKYMVANHFDQACKEKIVPAMRSLCQRRPYLRDQLMQQLIHYIFGSGRLSDSEKLAKLLSNIDDKAEETVLTLEQSLIQKGHARGRNEGHMEGQRELISKMLKNGADLKIIAKFTRQKPKEIENFLRTQKKEE